MKYSIIVPVYKVEKYLGQCVDSILKQTYKDFELILVDDGSPDNCPAICDNYAAENKNVTVFHQKNRGLANARNSGLKIAKGDYIIFIDSDDYLSSEDALAKIDRVLEQKPDVLVFGYRKYFESTDSFGSPVCDFPTDKNVLPPEQFLSYLITKDSYTGTAWAKVFKHELLLSNNIKFKEGMISEDTDFYLQIMLSAKSYTAINEALYTYRMRPDSISHAVKEQSLTDNLWIMETWPDKINTLAKDGGLKKTLMQIMARYMGNFMVLYSSYNHKIRSKYFNRVKNVTYLFDYAVTQRAIIIHRFIRLFGLRLTVLMLSTANKLKRRT